MCIVQTWSGPLTWYFSVDPVSISNILINSFRLNSVSLRDGRGRRYYSRTRKVRRPKIAEHEVPIPRLRLSGQVSDRVLPGWQLRPQ